MALDTTTKWGQHAEQRLRSDDIAWLTTVSANGRPYTVPVWFLWEGETILIFSQREKLKLRNIHANSYVTLAIDGTHHGGDVVIIEGKAELLDDPGIKPTLPAYVAKYGESMKSMGWTPEIMGADFSQAIRVIPTRFRDQA